MRRVLIATPSHSGQVDVWYCNALFWTGLLCLKQEIEILPLSISYDSLIQKVRNEYITTALASGVDDLIFIDSDQHWKPESVPKLLSYPVDCVGGAVKKKNDNPDHYNVMCTAWPIPVDIKTGLLVVEGLGCGFLRLTRKAMQALWDSSEEYTNEAGEKHRWIFDLRPIGGRLVGEDKILGMKLTALGIKVHLDPTMTCAHIGVKKYEGDFAAFLERLGQQRRAAKAAG